MVYPELTIIVVGALCKSKERNDSCALPLEDVVAFLICIEESVVLDCHALNRARNDACALPLGDVSTLILELLECLESQALVSSRA